MVLEFNPEYFSVQLCYYWRRIWRDSHSERRSVGELYYTYTWDYSNLSLCSVQQSKQRCSSMGFAFLRTLFWMPTDWTTYEAQSTIEGMRRSCSMTLLTRFFFVDDSVPWRILSTDASKLLLSNKSLYYRIGSYDVPRSMVRHSQDIQRAKGEYQPGFYWEISYFCTYVNTVRLGLESS